MISIREISKTPSDKDLFILSCVCFCCSVLETSLTESENNNNNVNSFECVVRRVIYVVFDLASSIFVVSKHFCIIDN